MHWKEGAKKMTLEITACTLGVWGSAQSASKEKDQSKQTYSGGSVKLFGIFHVE